MLRVSCHLVYNLFRFPIHFAFSIFIHFPIIRILPRPSFPGHRSENTVSCNTLNRRYAFSKLPNGFLSIVGLLLLKMPNMNCGLDSNLKL